MTMSGTDLIRAERYRQKQAENYQAEGDKGRAHELAAAAAVYALDGIRDISDLWPWAPEYYKPRDARRNLIRAGALIAAALEALDD